MIAPIPIPVYDLGRVPYRRALEFQRRAVETRARNESPDVLYYLEHEPVITVGRAGHVENLRAGAAELSRAGISIVPVERGGDVTYHGPGQLIGYPIVSLDTLPGGRDLHRYLRDLEQALIETLDSFGLPAGRRPPYTGVWVGDRKVAAIGVAVRRWVAFHGFALNIDPDLRHFDLIHPCGIRHLGVASMASLLGAAPSRDVVMERLTRALGGVWGRPMIAASINAEPRAGAEKAAHA